jgi:two-component system sensor histidine kinase RegB
MTDVKTPKPAPTAHEINFAWLLRLRWGAIAGQAVTIVLVARFLHFELPVGAIFAIIMLEMASNVAGTAWLDRHAITSERPLVLLLSLDILALTGMLYLTGGPMNPFNFLYLVYLALAAVVVSTRWTWALAALSLASFGGLFFESRELEAIGTMSPGAPHDMTLHLQGMWVAFAVAAAFIVYFVSRVSRGLTRREVELARARSVAARNEKLASLATLAAGAAHELSTPLSTIAVVAKELERELVSRDASARAGNGGSTAHVASSPAQTSDGPAQDARLIRNEVERCRLILHQMAAEAGESPGEALAEVAVRDLVDMSLEGLADREHVRSDFDAATASRFVRVPPRAVAEALRALVKNASEASAPQNEVLVHARLVNGSLRIEVRDQGAGMDAAVLARAGEPFFSTKGPGSGMGLGLFLARAITDRLGGTLDLASEPKRGTTAALTFPVAPPATSGRIAASRGVVRE